MAKEQRMTEYQKNKERVRNEAIKYANSFAEHDCSYGELADNQGYFEKLGRRYGLLREFKENGII